MSAHDDPRTLRTLSAFFDVVRSAEMMARGGAAATHPRDLIARRLRGFVRAFDRGHGWPTSGPDAGDLGESLRRRALAIAEVLDAQAVRARMPR